MTTKNLKFLALDTDTKEIVALSREDTIAYLSLTSQDQPAKDDPKPDPKPTAPPVVEPKPETPVYGYPRRQLGNWTDDKKNTYPVFEGSGVTTELIVQLKDSPDTIMQVGYNNPYKPLPGVTRPAGPESFWGVGRPAGSKDPDGYERKTSTDGAVYFVKKSNADFTDLGDKEVWKTK